MPNIHQMKGTTAKTYGSGIDLADFVRYTFFRAANGLAKRTIQTITPNFPIIGEANDLLTDVARSSVSVIKSEPYLTC